MRRTAHSVNLFRTAMNALESLIVERWNTQKLLSAISQQSSLQNVATWVVFQKETQDELARVLQVNLSNSTEAHSCLLTRVLSSAGLNGVRGLLPKAPAALAARCWYRVQVPGET